MILMRQDFSMLIFCSLEALNAFLGNFDVFFDKLEFNRGAQMSIVLALTGMSIQAYIVSEKFSLFLLFLSELPNIFSIKVSRKLFSGNEKENKSMFEFACLIGLIIGAPISCSLAELYGNENLLKMCCYLNFFAAVLVIIVSWNYSPAVKYELDEKRVKMPSEQENNKTTNQWPIVSIITDLSSSVMEITTIVSISTNQDITIKEKGQFLAILGATILVNV
ncbi:DgyrCDS3379 [Dimorphilus gyrociliatus]|uniref:DgyrCDS3379 n=1 Tax=Dimorphilus gyrociliatus TaxID=2664684 RepID=A0A7I8VI47_9ANNE|nr:DgyrCDS3379 [Dimorphilus gyrociliatus]